MFAFEDWLTRHLRSGRGWPAAPRIPTWHRVRRIRELADLGRLTRTTVCTGKRPRPRTADHPLTRPPPIPLGAQTLPLTMTIDMP